MSLRKRVLQFLATPVHIHVNLPFHQTAYIRLDTPLGYYADEEFENATLSLQGLGAMLSTDGPRNLDLTVAAGLLGLCAGTYKRFNEGY